MPVVVTNCRQCFTAAVQNYPILCRAADDSRHDRHGAVIQRRPPFADRAPIVKDIGADAEFGQFRDFMSMKLPLRSRYHSRYQHRGQLD